MAINPMCTTPQSPNFWTNSWRSIIFSFVNITLLVEVWYNLSYCRWRNFIIGIITPRRFASSSPVCFVTHDLHSIPIFNLLRFLIRSSHTSRCLTVSVVRKISSTRLKGSWKLLCCWCIVDQRPSLSMISID